MKSCACRLGEHLLPHPPEVNSLTSAFDDRGNRGLDLQGYACGYGEVIARA